MGLRIVVGGFMGLLPAGGVTWDYIQYPIGLRQLGHDVFYVEDTRLWPVYQRDGDQREASHIANLASAMNAFGLSDRWAYRDEATGTWFGLSAGKAREILHTADVFINVSCATAIGADYEQIPIRVLVDSDPMFTQIQSVASEAFTVGGGGMQRLIAAHTHHFTFGENVGAPDCRMPNAGFTWIPTRQPICLDHWHVSPIAPVSPFTTVMNWQAGRALSWDGETWGQKDIELMRFLGLPRALPGTSFVLAIGQTTKSAFPADTIDANGWQVVAAESSAPDWRRYREFIARSYGEWSVAKETYVKARTGWFSGRSASYLASGRPVVAQDTGWTTVLPNGEGLFGFTTQDEAVEAIRQVIAEPRRHAVAARRIAEEHFGSAHVLQRLLRQVGAA